MWVREHIEIVNDVELNISKFSDVDRFLAHDFLIGFFRIFIHVIARPNSDLAIIERSKQATVRGK